MKILDGLQVIIQLQTQVFYLEQQTVVNLGIVQHSIIILLVCVLLIRIWVLQLGIIL